MGLGSRGWRQVGLGICKLGGVGSGSSLTPWILCSAVRRTISLKGESVTSRVTHDKFLTPWISFDQTAFTCAYLPHTCKCDTLLFY